MAKKAKAFSRIFSAAEVKKGLLSDDFDNIPESGKSGDFDADDDDDFPIQAHRPSSADDLGFPEYDDQGFGVVRSASDGQFPEATGAFDSSFVASESGGFDDFGDAGAFEGDNSNNSGKLLAGFGEAEDEEDDEDFQVDDAVVEAAFQASFSGLEAANKAAEAQSSPAAQNGKKVKKRFTRIFTGKKSDKPEEPVSRCGEIVVDKSKIPTTKVDMDIVNGQLVAKRDGVAIGQEEEDKDKTKNRSTFKSIRKYAKKRAEEMGVLGPKEGMDSSMSSQKGLDDMPEGSETANDNSEEAAETPATDEVRRGDPRQRRRRRSLTEGEIVPGGSQRERGERRRREKGGAGGRLAGGKPRSSEENGGRPRRSRKSNKDGGEIRFQRNLTSDSAGVGKGRRRQSLMEKHAPTDHSPRRSNRPRDGLDESNRRGIDESHRRASDESHRRRHRGEGTDASNRRGGKGADMDASNRRGNRRSAREPRKSMRRAISTDETGEVPKARPERNNLSATSHGPMRRASTMDSSAIRRAQSTRRLGKNDLMGESGHKVAGGLTDRERLRRATMVGDNKNNNARQGLGSLYGGRAVEQSSESDDEEEGGEPKRRSRSISDGDILHETVDEEDGSESSEGMEPGNNAEGEETFAAVSGISLLASGKLTSNDVEKLVKAVVRKAEDAIDDEEVEAIVMETLHQSSAVGFDVSIANLIDEDLDISVDSEVSLEEDRTKGGLNRKQVRDRTRNYVNVFLKSGLAGGDARVGKLVASKLGGRNDGEMLEGIDESEGIDEDTLDKSNACSIDEGTYVDDESNNKHGNKKMSRENLAEKMQAVKAAKALAAGTKDETKQKPDFSAVASRLEAKAEAKTKARMRHKVAK